MFNSIFIFLIPALFGIKSVWIGIIVAEVLVILITFMLAKQNSTKVIGMEFQQQTKS